MSRKIAKRIKKYQGSPNARLRRKCRLIAKEIARGIYEHAQRPGLMRKLLEMETPTEGDVKAHQDLMDLADQIKAEYNDTVCEALNIPKKFLQPSTSHPEHTGISNEVNVYVP